MSYEIVEDKKAIRFMDKIDDDEELSNRIKKQYKKLSENPYKYAEESFYSNKCHKCKKTRVGDYRIIYYVNESLNIVQIIDIDHRKKIYKKWDR
ncbi:MAG: hypothetical protein BZ137_06105 [Methanosphaera sp. rholeuAM130]|nr:type II toxin-antitoxin system RelE/ParE family toxin [Methanosphaera sp.]RAP53710.1 MAG: hypothetical protein BZ137_06105 [Methanosphaera sp. rholeuAM130]